MDEATRNELLADMASRYQPEHYSLLKHNCNHFSNDFCQLLCGSAIPVGGGEAGSLARNGWAIPVGGSEAVTTRSWWVGVRLRQRDPGGGSVTVSLTKAGMRGGRGMKSVAML